MGENTHSANNVLFYKDFPRKKRSMFNEFTLPKTGGKASAELLTPAHLEQVLALHEATRAALPTEQKMFVLPQKPDYFEKFLTQKEGVMLGILAGDKLVAQLAIMGPLLLEDVIGRHTVTRNDIAFHHTSALDQIVAIKSMAVHPDFRGNELSQHILTAALDLPLVHAADQVFCQISVDNTRSWELFLKNGFGIVGAAVDPGDQKARFILQKPAHGFALDIAPSADDVDPVEDFQGIMKLTQREALIGHIDENAPTKGLRLAFSASAETAAALSRVAEGD
jgi:ribosomal protein S18 acetylase RimI-like enzyme